MIQDIFWSRLQTTEDKLLMSIEIYSESIVTLVKKTW